MIMGRKAFQRPFNEGVKLINAVQEIYLSKEITIA
jgi:class I fructose-bisphosphate aldolase